MTPDFFNVLVGKEKILSMPYETVVASMTHQFLSTTSEENVISDTYYYVFLSASKQIEKWLTHCKDEDFLNPIDLFGEWMPNFIDYTAAQNKRLTKDLIFTFSDGSEWTMRIVDLLWIKQRKENDYNTFSMVNTDDPFLRSESEMLSWVQENCSWEEISDYVMESKRPQPELNYDENFKSCEKKFVEWADDFSILDLISGQKTDIVFIEDDDD